MRWNRKLYRTAARLTTTDAREYIVNESLRSNSETREIH